MKVDIVDVGCGNIRSIKNCLERANVQASVISKSRDIINSDILILPGVGAAGIYMSRLKKKSFDQRILEHYEAGKRIIGICLGFQILTSFTEEDGGVEGLNLIDGHTEKLKGDISHNGWESINIRKDSLQKEGLNSQFNLSQQRVLKGRVFYNHEYGVVNKEKKSFNLPISENLKNYSALILKGNLIGIQFHPEKSQKTGLNLISMIL